MELLTFHRPAAGNALLAGEPVTGPYFERFWLPVVGPTAFVVMRHLAGQLRDQAPYEVDALELAGALGVYPNLLDKTLARLEDMRLLKRVGQGPGAWQVRLKVTQLDDRQVRRLPRCLARQHRQMAAALTSSAS